MPRIPGAALAAVASLLACGDDGPTGPDRPTGFLHASLDVQPALVAPGQSSVVTATVSLPDSARLDRADIRIEGLGADTTLRLPVSGRGLQSWGIELFFPNGPIEGELAFRLVARLGTDADTATATLRVQDDGPPRIRFRVAGIVEPPDTLSIWMEAEDAAGLTDLSIRVRGVITRDTTRAFDYRSLGEVSLNLPFDRSIRLGDSVVVTAEARDGFGKLTTMTQLVRVADTTYPFVRASVDTIQQSTPIDMSSFPLLFFPGDTVRIHLDATDNHSLTWLGYLYPYLGLGDSIPLDSVQGSAIFSLELPPGTNSDQPIMYFAWDGSGHRFSTWIFLAVMDGAFRTIEELSPPSPMSNIPYQSTYVLDEQRDVLYYTAYPSTALYRLGLNPPAIPSPMNFGRGVRALSSSAGGDSLWVLLIGRPNLLVGWEAAKGPTPTDTIPLPELGNCDGWNLQVAEGGRAWVTGWSQTGCPTVEVNLRDKSRRMRHLPSDLRHLAASGDRRTIVAWNASDAMVYYAEMDLLGPRRVLFPGMVHDHLGFQEPAFDRTGTKALVRNRLYDRQLATYRSLLPDSHMPDPQALSWDGNTAFIGEWPGYWRVDVESGTVMERVILPRIPWRLIPHPDGQRLIVFAGGWAGVVDLR